MLDYIVSARKYRPSTFHSVVGQQGLTTTLKNAIANNKLAHAYLFCGPRGVGKTTCARIFAKTINCFSPTADGEACNECESCVAFNEQRSFNIHELDAASNNSVDDIRNLIDQVRIPPQLGEYKVYIIDEVHMLSQAAFNAFLKTLEEPPHHAIFILATTEKYKILPTILSRCQVYDFNRITLKDTVDHLQYVASQEGINAEPEALSVIAQKADGGMRDALSIFDQIVSYTQGQVTYASVIENLNILDFDYYFQMTDFFLTQNVTGALMLFDKVLSRGFDGQHFTGGLATHLRSLLVAQDTSTLILLETTDTVKDKYRQQTSACNPQFLYDGLEICNECDMQYKQSRNKRLLVELSLIRLCQLNGEKKKSDNPFRKPIEPVFSQPAVAPQQSIQATQHQGTTPATHQAIAQQSPTPPVGYGQQNQSNGQRAINMGGTSAKIAETKAKPLPKMSTFSIRKGAVQKEAEVEKPTLGIQEKRNTPFTEMQLMTVWRNFIEENPDEHHLISIMAESLPSLTNNQLTVGVYNQIDLKKLLECATIVSDYLREKLANDYIFINVIELEPSPDSVIFTAKEKFEFMLNKNKSLKRLADKFKLRLM